MGDDFIQGRWSKLERREGFNWKELRAPNRVLDTWCAMLAGKLVLARMDNSTAVAYANPGAGCASQLTVVARKIKEREVAMGCSVAALHIAGRGNSVADFLSRFSIRVRGMRPYPERELRWRFRIEVGRLCGPVDVDVLASDGGRNSWVANFRPPSNSAFEGPLPHRRLWWPPRLEMAELGTHLRYDWLGTHLALAPLTPWKHWFPKLARFERALIWNAGAQLFADSERGFRRWKEYAGRRSALRRTRKGVLFSTTAKYS